MDAQGRVHFGVYDGARQIISTTTALNDGRWHHVAGSMGPGGLSLYVDGTLVGTRTGVTRANAITGYWRVGGDRGWLSTAEFFAGAIDEVAVYPRALSAQEVAAHRTFGSTGQAPNTAPTLRVRMKREAASSTESHSGLDSPASCPWARTSPPTSGGRPSRPWSPWTGSRSRSTTAP